MEDNLMSEEAYFGVCDKINKENIDRYDWTEVAILNDLKNN